MSGTQRLVEVHHVERDMIEFMDQVQGAPFSVAMGRAIWEELGSPGKLIVTLQTWKGGGGD